MPNYHNLASKLDRAIAAYLVAQGVGTADNIHPGKSALDKPIPCIVVATSTLDCPEGDWFSGNRVATVAIGVKHKPEQADDDATNETTRAAADELLANLVDALMQQGQSSDRLYEAINEAAWALADDDAENHADLLNFSIFGLQHLGESQGFDEEGLWNDIIRLRVHCAPYNVA